MDITNAIRTIKKNKIDYEVLEYENAISGDMVAKALNENPDFVYKTLVTIGKSSKHYVFMIPVLDELDLKKAAKVTNEKSIEMIKSKDLLPLTGYIHGGCSPIGMKKEFLTFISDKVKYDDVIMFSGGKIGLQIKMKFSDLNKVIRITKALLS